MKTAMTELDQLLRGLNLAHHQAQEKAVKKDWNALLIALDALEIAEERLRSFIEKGQE